MFQPPQRKPRSRVAESPQPTHGVRRGEVLDVDGEVVLVRIDLARPEAVRRASLAVVGYEPQPNDAVVLLGGDDDLFVVGVLGEARLRQPQRDDATLVLRARERIVLDAPAIELRSEETSLVASRATVSAASLEVDTSTLVERADHTYRYARGSAHCAAGEARTVVDGHHQLVAGRTTIVSEEDTVVDGARVLLA